MPEIDELDLAIARQHDVARRQVAMDHAIALAMRVIEAIEHTPGDPRGDGRLHPRALGGHALGEPVQRRPIDVVHRDEIRVIDHAELVDRHDVAVCERDQRLGLGDEQVDEVSLAREPRMDLLDHDRFLEPAGTDQLAEEDLGHARRWPASRSDSTCRMSSAAPIRPRASPREYHAGTCSLGRAPRSLARRMRRACGARAARADRPAVGRSDKPVRQPRGRAPCTEIQVIAYTPKASRCARRRDRRFPGRHGADRDRAVRRQRHGDRRRQDRAAHVRNARRWRTDPDRGVAAAWFLSRGRAQRAAREPDCRARRLRRAGHRRRIRSTRRPSTTIPTTATFSLVELPDALASASD